MIDRITIHRFRGIRQGHIDRMPKVNLFIGPNDSGKTALLELLYLSATCGRPAIFIRDDLPRATGMLPARTTLAHDFSGHPPFRRFCQRHGKRGEWKENPIALTQEQGIAVRLDQLKNDVRGPDAPWAGFRLEPPRPEWGEKDRPAFAPTDLSQIALFSLPQPKALDASMIPAPFVEAGIQPGDADWHYLWAPDWVYRWTMHHPLDRLAVWTTHGTKPDPSRVLFYDTITARSHLPTSFARWADNAVPDWHERIAARMTEIFPSLREATIEVADAPDGQDGRTGYVRFPDQTPLGIDQLGDGARSAFHLIAYLTALTATVDDTQQGMVLLEDPEAFQNPATLGRLLDVVVRLTQEKPIQVFMTTQSLEVIAHVTLMLQRHILPPEETLAFRLNLRDGVLRSSWFNHKNLASWLESGRDPRVLEDIDAPLRFHLRDDAHENPGLCQAKPRRR